MIPPPDGPDVARFDRVERYVHWSQAWLFGLLFATAAALYVPPLSQLVGRREIVRTIHVYAGLGLPLPVVLGLLGRRGAGLRADLGRLNRFSRADRSWLRSRGDGRGLYTGKFNAGQKLNAAFVGGTILVMLATGSIMRWFKPFPLPWRTGATFVHDWLAIALLAVVIGHIVIAKRDPESLAAMRHHGKVSRAWARRKAPAWLDEVDATDEPAGV